MNGNPPAPTQETMEIKTPARIALNASERALIANKVALIKQGDQARADLSALVGCIVERAGQPLGEYELDPVGATLIKVGQ